MLRLEGIAASAAHRAAALGKDLAAYGPVEIVEDAASQAIWASVRDVLPFAAGGALGAWPVWRIICPPASIIFIHCSTDARTLSVGTLVID